MLTLAFFSQFYQFYSRFFLCDLTQAQHCTLTHVCTHVPCSCGFLNILSHSFFLFALHFTFSHSFGFHPDLLLCFFYLSSLSLLRFSAAWVSLTLLLKDEENCHVPSVTHQQLAKHCAGICFVYFGPFIPLYNDFVTVLDY